MFRLAREYKPYTIGIIFIIILLFIQAVTELALPEYMSNIVNIGIEQNGIQNTVPVVIKREDMDRIKLFIDKETRELVEDNYKLIDKNDLNREEYEKLLKEYPIINTEDLYILNTKSKKV
ncbi:MAG: ABC transporter ATP-binding protein, partial [Clostridiales bacterium]|nr:ABC transporter ATP-binding protein [Clostridiales bacterium]